MTNPSPQDPQNPIPERRRRPASGVTFDEMIGIIVAFTTIGAILFWTLGGKKGGLANFGGLVGGNSLLSNSDTTSTGFGLNNGVISNSKSNTNASITKSDEREIINKLRQSESPVAFVPPSQELNLPPKVKKQSYQLDSGAKLVPLAGVAVPALTAKPEQNKNNITTQAPAKKKPQSPAPIEAPKKKPQPPAFVEPPAKKKPQAIVPIGIPKDITKDNWIYPFVKQMSDNGLASTLIGDKNFEPNKLITRASMATLISRAFDMQPETQGIRKFNDVSNGNEIAVDIDKAVRLGFMKGYSKNTFRPLENIPRYQVLVALATGLGLKPSQNADQALQKLKGSENLPDWAKEQVAAAYEAKLIVNRPGFEDSLMPNKSATRGEVAAMIHQALVQEGKLKPLESKYILKP